MGKIIVILVATFLILYWRVKRIVRKIHREDAMSREVENHINLEDDI